MLLTGSILEAETTTKRYQQTAKFSLTVDAVHLILK